MTATKFGLFETIKILFDKYNASLEYRNVENLSGLEMAMHYDFEEIYSYYLNKMQNILTQNPDFLKSHFLFII